MCIRDRFRDKYRTYTSYEWHCICIRKCLRIYLTFYKRYLYATSYNPLAMKLNQSKPNSEKAAGVNKKLCFFEQKRKKKWKNRSSNKKQPNSMNIQLKLTYHLSLHYSTGITLAKPNPTLSSFVMHPKINDTEEKNQYVDVLILCIWGKQMKLGDSKETPCISNSPSLTRWGCVT